MAHRSTAPSPACLTRHQIAYRLHSSSKKCGATPLFPHPCFPISLPSLLQLLNPMQQTCCHRILSSKCHLPSFGPYKMAHESWSLSTPPSEAPPHRSPIRWTLSCLLATNSNRPPASPIRSVAGPASPPRTSWAGAATGAGPHPFLRHPLLLLPPPEPTTPSSPATRSASRHPSLELPPRCYRDMGDAAAGEAVLMQQQSNRGMLYGRGVKNTGGRGGMSPSARSWDDKSVPAAATWRQGRPRLQVARSLDALWHLMSLIHMTKLITCLRDTKSYWNSKLGFKF
jgi:hypothetical protein